MSLLLGFRIVSELMQWCLYYILYDNLLKYYLNKNQLIFSGS